MHDPKTVAHEIKLWRWHLVTIWHVDPETDGSDDSCGWSFPHITDRDRGIIDKMVDWDTDFPYYSSPGLPTTIVDPAYSSPKMTAGDCLAHVAVAWAEIAWRRDRMRNFDIGDWNMIVSLAANSHDNLRAVLTNKADAERVRHFFSCVMRAYLQHHRPWWRHPRWHIRHLKLQIHPLQAFKRWRWSRCALCGRKFKWGESPVSHRRDGTGPLWFKSEERIYHQRCSGVVLSNKSATVAILCDSKEETK